MSLDWSLDDIIKANRKASKAIQGVGSNKRRSECSPYSYDRPKPKSGNIEGKWEHDLFSDRSPRKQNRQRTVRSDREDTSSCLRVSNMPTDLTDKDFEEMAREFRCSEIRPAINGHGQFLGMIDITYNSKKEAEQALIKYKGSKMDGQLLHMKVITPCPNTKAGCPEIPSITERLSFPSMKKNRSPKEHSNKKPERRSDFKFLDRLSDDKDFKQEEKKKLDLKELDADLESYMRTKK